MSQEGFSTLLVHFEGSSPPVAELREALEAGDIRTKIDTMKKLIVLQLNGEPQNHMIMTVIKYCVPKDDHTLQKLVFYFWESVDKTDGNGQLLPETILICSHLLSGLQHPNEYVRGVTMRFLCKVRERDVLEPLVASVIANLSHRVTFVRRNAVVAVHSIFAKLPELIPDAPELVDKFLQEETDASSKRHAFLMLMNSAPARAVAYLMQHRDEIGQSGEVLQLAVVEQVKQLIASNPFDRPKYIPIVFAALQSRNPSVLFQCASTLLALSSSPTAIKSATQTLVNLLTTHTDNNVRLIVLERLAEIKRRSRTVLEGALLDVLRALTTSADMDVRRRILDFTLDLVTPKNAESFLVAMKKELSRAQSEDASAVPGDSAVQAASAEYRRHLLQAITKVVLDNLDLAPSVMPILLDQLCDDATAANEVAQFLRHALHRLPAIRAETLAQLGGLLPMINSASVLRTVVWLLGVYSGPETSAQVATTIKSALEPMPLTAPTSSTSDAKDDAPATVATTVVREDGTYGVVLNLVNKRSERERSDVSGLRGQIVAGDYFLAAAVANTLAKITVTAFHGHGTHKTSVQADATDMIREMIRYGSSGALTAIDEDSHERLRVALTVVQNPRNDFVTSFVQDTDEAFAETAPTNAKAAGDAQADLQAASVDQPMSFSQLNSAIGGIEISLDDAPVADASALSVAEKVAQRLKRVVQLSGVADAVYAEATVTVNPFDIVLDLLLVNQTAGPLNNVTVELVTKGDLRICERPQTFWMPAGSQVASRASIKVSSTETAYIFGTITYETGSNSSDRGCVILNEIPVDMMDYVQAASCSASDFRAKWTDFEWENKVPLPGLPAANNDLRAFVEAIRTHVKMQEVDGASSAPDASGFLSTSLFARSAFGEVVLANVSVELTEEGTVEGIIRVRAKSEGIARALGDKIKALLGLP
jgi:coatomer subunit beta